MSKLLLEVVFDYEGFVDYYQGHGHAFTPENVVACLRFGIPINYRETVKDIIQGILEDLNSYMDPVEYLNEAESNPSLREEIMNFLTDENIETAIRAEIGDLKDEDKFFDIDLDDDLEDFEEDPYMEYPYLIGYIHVWKEDE